MLQGGRENAGSGRPPVSGDSWSRVHPKEHSLNDRELQGMESTLISVETNMRLFREANRRR